MNFSLFFRQISAKSKIGFQILWSSLIIIFIGFTLYTNRQNLVNYDYDFNITFLTYSILFALLRRLWGGVHWAYLISVVSKIAFVENLFSNIYTYFIANLASYLPGSIWYIPWRMQINKRVGISGINTSVGSIIETIILVISGGLVSLPLFFLIVSSDQIVDLRVLLGTIFLGIIMIHPRLIHLGFKVVSHLLNRELEAPKLKFSQLAISLTLMLVMWLTLGASLFFLTKSVYQPLTNNSFLFITSAFALAWVVGFLTPFAPAGLGVREGVLTWLFSLHMPIHVATITAISSRLIFILEDITWVSIMFLFSDKGAKTVNLLINKVRS